MDKLNYSDADEFQLDLDSMSPEERKKHADDVLEAGLSPEDPEDAANLTSLVAESNAAFLKKIDTLGAWAKDQKELMQFATDTSKTDNKF